MAGQPNKYPVIDITAVVLDAYNVLQLLPTHVSFYTVLQCSKITGTTQLVLYVVYRARDRHRMDVTTVEHAMNPTIPTFARRALHRLQQELVQNRVPPEWIAYVNDAISHLSDGQLQLGI